MINGGWCGPGWRVFPADPSRAKDVRDWIGSVAAAHPCPADPGDAALLAGELFGNAAVHGPAGGLVLAGCCLWSGGMRLAVCDGGGPGGPRLLRGASPDGASLDGASLDGAENGRGLLIVDAIAARWDTFRLPDGVRVVWCDLGQQLRAPDADAWAWLPPALAASPLSGTAPPHTPAASCGRPGHGMVIAAGRGGAR